MRTSKVSVCIATYNMGHLLTQTIQSIKYQTHKNLEIIVFDDNSNDGTETLPILEGCVYVRSNVNHGVGNAFNMAIEKATGTIVMLMCADDLLRDRNYIKDACNVFGNHKTVGYITRYYFQFVGHNIKPVRAWRSKNPIVLANNPSGLMFRRKALENAKCSNKMFIETSYLASKVLESWASAILAYDAVAVRIHDSTSTKKEYYLKRRVSSPVKDWVSVGGNEILKDYCSLVQIKCNYTTKALCEEILNFITMRPVNVFMPTFWFYAILTIITPRTLLRKIPHLYRKYIGVLITKEIKRK
jgi:glycosyltransferase involved in cell wall biosynthesis